METISELRDRILELYGRVEVYVTPVLRFILTLVSLIFINSKLGYMGKITNFIIVFGVSLISAFLPLNFAALICALFILLHMYGLSIQVAAVVGLIIVLMFVLYFRFAPKCGAALLLTPLLFAMKIPYVIALIIGFVGGPLSFLSVGCGTVIYYIIDTVSENSNALGGEGSISAESALSGFKAVIDIVVNNNTMILMVIVVSLVCVLANVIKRFKFDYSWQVALAVAVVAGLITVIIGASALDADVSIVGSIISMVISSIIVFVVLLFIHDLDYSRAEYVQFEDDEYYYYVKAIPRYLTETRPRGRDRNY